MAHSEKVHTTVSKEASGKGSAWASAWRRSTTLPGPGLGDAEHGRAEINPGQLHLSGIKGQVQAGADADLQGVPGGLRADPGAAVG
jgi:hypothetical protein